MTHSGPIIIDGVIFQMQQHRPHGISRLWQSLLREVSKLPRGKGILLLDRDGTAPEFPGIRMRRVPPFSLRDLERQATFLDAICRKEGAALFLSTYYSYARNTPSILMLYDMILELFFHNRPDPANLVQLVTRLELMAKKMAIKHACAYMAISRSTAEDFKKLYPEKRDQPVAIVPCAVSDDFRVNGATDIASFCNRYNIKQPYFLLVGRRGEYKNARLFLKAFTRMPGREKCQVVMAGGERELDPESRTLLADALWHHRFFSDGDLSLAYSGAAALIYPSLYEGFGLPLLEAMQSGCPVITSRISSIPEVAGDAALYLEQPDEPHMLRALAAVQQPEVRKGLIEKGLRRASLFSWQRSAVPFCDMLDSVAAGLKTRGNSRASSTPACEPSEHAAMRARVASSGDGAGPGIRVSAIVSAYNSETFIEGCLQDLVEQTLYKKGMLEIIVVDTASPQREGEIVAGFRERYPNIAYLRTEQRETVYQAWNRGIRVARGEFVTNANTDDRHCHSALERMLHALDQRPDVALVYADVLKTETPCETYDRCTPTGRYRWYDWDRNVLLERGCFMGPQPMWRRSMHGIFGGFDEHLVTSGDFEFWLRISQIFDFYHIREPLGLYLINPESIEHRNRDLKHSEDHRILSLYRSAASRGDIIRCLALEALRQASGKASCGSNGRWGDHIQKIEMLAGLHQSPSKGPIGIHPGDAERLGELKKHVLNSQAPADAVDEFIRLSSGLILSRTSWVSRYREKAGGRISAKAAGGRNAADNGRFPAGRSSAERSGQPRVRIYDGGDTRFGLQPEAHAKMSRLRSELARFWLQAPLPQLERLYSGEAGNLQRQLVFGRLRELPASQEDRQMAAGLLERIAKALPAEGPARPLLAAMLYLDPQHLPAGIDFLAVPAWLRPDYAQFLLSGSGIFEKPGEAEAYGGGLDRLTACICAAIRRDPHAPDWQRIAQLFAEKANFIPLYFSRRNLKTLYARRAEILDYTLRLRRCDLDYRFPPRPVSRTKIRLGIHCRSLRPHTEIFATLPVFEYLERDQFEIFLYVHGVNGGPLEERVRAASDKFTVLPQAIRDCADIIRSDELDILFFGNNMTAVQNQSAILASYRLARVQCIHFCNPVTSGKRHIDYFLLGRMVADNHDGEARFTEKILTVEGSGICFDAQEPAGAAEQRLSREDLNIEGGQTVFVSGANCFKIVPELRRAWARVLTQVPNSVLVLYPFGPAWAGAYPKQLLVEDLKRVWAGHGLDPSRMIVLGTLEGQPDILALNRIADVYLDAFPYNGATSLLEPLQAGTPPVVADGGELRFSQGAAILRELGLQELIARGEEDYIRVAARLGMDTRLREEMRERIRRHMAAGPDFLNPRLYGQRVGQAFQSLFADVGCQAARASRLQQPGGFTDAGTVFA